MFEKLLIKATNLLTQVGRINSQLGWQFQLGVAITALRPIVLFLPPCVLGLVSDPETQLTHISGSDFLRLLVIVAFLTAGCLILFRMGCKILDQWLSKHVFVALRRRMLTELFESANGYADQNKWLEQLCFTETFLNKHLFRLVSHLTILVGSIILFSFYNGWSILIPITAAAILAVVNRLVKGLPDHIPHKRRNVPSETPESIRNIIESLLTIRSLNAEAYIKSLYTEPFLMAERRCRSPINHWLSSIATSQIITLLIVTVATILICYRTAANSLTIDEVFSIPIYGSLILYASHILLGSVQHWRQFYNKGNPLPSLNSRATDTTQNTQTIVGTIGVTSISGRGIKSQGSTQSQLNFELKRGELLAIFGTNRSTLLKIMSGVESKYLGEFFLQTGPHDVENVPFIPKEICAYIEKQPYFVEGTIMDNIRFGQSGIFDHEILSAIQMVGLEPTLTSAGGLHAPLMTQTDTWNTSQLYLLSLCRALVRQRPFLMLDDPFAVVDASMTPELLTTLEWLKQQGVGVALSTYHLVEGLSSDRQQTQ